MTEIEATGDLLIMVGTPGKAATGAASKSPDLPLVVSLVEAARQGNRDAFGDLYRMYSPMVHAILLARTPWSEVDDLVQDVFLTAYRKIAALRDPGSFGAWLGMIARNRAMDYHRRTRRVEKLNGEVQDRSTLEARADAQRILSAIRELPEAYRETLVMRLVEGMSGPEIAERTGLTVGSVRVNLHRGIKILRESLGMEEAQ